MFSSIAMNHMTLRLRGEHAPIPKHSTATDLCGQMGRNLLIESPSGAPRVEGDGPMVPGLLAG